MQKPSFILSSPRTQRHDGAVLDRVRARLTAPRCVRSHFLPWARPLAALRLHPDVPLAARLKRRLDELHPDEPVLDGREHHRRVGLAAFAGGADGASDLAVEIGEAFEITFRVT